jgi:hypothetical protein
MQLAKETKFMKIQIPSATNERDVASACEPKRGGRIIPKSSARAELPKIDESSGYFPNQQSKYRVQMTA